MADCVTMLNIILHNPPDLAKTLAHPAVISGCVQAFETEHAARIQASAARQSGTMAMVAGGSAIMAGAIAYAAAVRGVRAAEREKAAAAAAFQRYLHVELVQVANQLEVYYSLFEQQERHFFEMYPIENYLNRAINLCEKLTPDNWQEFAKFGSLGIHYEELYFPLMKVMTYWRTAHSQFNGISPYHDANWRDKSEIYCERLRRLTEDVLKTIKEKRHVVFPSSLESPVHRNPVSNLVRRYLGMRAN